MGDVSYLCYVPSIVGLRLIPNVDYQVPYPPNQPLQRGCGGAWPRQGPLKRQSTVLLALNFPAAEAAITQAGSILDLLEIETRPHSCIGLKDSSIPPTTD